MARVVCHLLLPSDVQLVMSLDLGDLLVFEDLQGLWAEFDRMEVGPRRSYRVPRRTTCWRRAMRCS